MCSKEGKEVPYEEIGNEYDGVVVTDEELSAADPAKTRTIDIESFVKLDEIDPIYFDHPYYLSRRARPTAPCAPTGCWRA